MFKDYVNNRYQTLTWISSLRRTYLAGVTSEPTSHLRLTPALLFKRILVTLVSADESNADTDEVEIFDIFEIEDEEILLVDIAIF